MRETLFKLFTKLAILTNQDKSCPLAGYAGCPPEIEMLYKNMVIGFENIIGERDQTTKMHLEQTQKYSLIVMRPLRSMARLDDIFCRAHHQMIGLHDVGKVFIPAAILKCPGSLSPVQFGLMQQHTVVGVRTLNGINGNHFALEIGKQIILSHHERWDGSGYPNGLKGYEIPISARIAAVVDVYEAITSPRPYKPGFSHREAMEKILKGDGKTQPTFFDPTILKALVLADKELESAHLEYSQKNKSVSSQTPS